MHILCKHVIPKYGTNNKINTTQINILLMIWIKDESSVN